MPNGSAALTVVTLVLAGAALGALFYAGLWWTTTVLSRIRPAGPFMLASLLLRMGVLLGGFYLVAGSDWTRWMLCLLGFTLARIEVAWLTRPRPPGAPHAP